MVKEYICYLWQMMIGQYRNRVWTEYKFRPTPSVGPGTKSESTKCMEEDIHSRRDNMGSTEMMDGVGHSANNDTLSNEVVRVQDDESVAEIPDQLLYSRENKSKVVLRMSASVSVCEYSRGVCRVHKTRGIKSNIKTKTWKKKKYGYGWVTTYKTEYSCVVISELSTAPDIDSSAVRSHSPERGLLNLENQNCGLH